MSIEHGDPKSEAELSPDGRRSEVQKLFIQFKLGFPIPDISNFTRGDSSNCIEIRNTETDKVVATYKIDYKAPAPHQEETLLVKEISLSGIRPPSYEIFDGPSSGWVKNPFPVNLGIPKIGLISVLDEIKVLFDKLMPANPQAFANPKDADDKFSLVGGAPSYQ